MRNIVVNLELLLLCIQWDYTVDMSWQLIYFWSKKIHRLAMWFSIFFGVPLALSGVMIHKLMEGEFFLIPFDEPTVRFVHNKASNPFALTLAVMMMTGFLMWLVPKIMSARAKR